MILSVEFNKVVFRVDRPGRISLPECRQIKLIHAREIQAINFEGFKKLEKIEVNFYQKDEEQDSILNFFALLRQVPSPNLQSLKFRCKKMTSETLIKILHDNQLMSAFK
jgi:hypothetical protein